MNQLGRGGRYGQRVAPGRERAALDEAVQPGLREARQIFERGVEVRFCGIDHGRDGEVAAQGVRVNAISPGSVDTEMVARAIADLARQSGSDAEAIRARYEAAIPMGRFARPEEIAATVVALCSGLFSYVNGANIVIDGGELSR